MLHDKSNHFNLQKNLPRSTTKSRGVLFSFFYSLSLNLAGSERIILIERLRFSSTPNGRREFVPRDQVFPLFFVHSLLLLHKSKKLYASFNHMNRSGLFLPAYFLF